MDNHSLTPIMTSSRGWRSLGRKPFRNTWCWAFANACARSLRVGLELLTVLLSWPSAAISVASKHLQYANEVSHQELDKVEDYLIFWSGASSALGGLVRVDSVTASIPILLLN